MFDKPQSVTLEWREFIFQTTNRPSHPAGFWHCGVRIRFVDTDISWQAVLRYQAKEANAGLAHGLVLELPEAQKEKKEVEGTQRNQNRNRRKVRKLRYKRGTQSFDLLLLFLGLRQFEDKAVS